MHFGSYVNICYKIKDENKCVIKTRQKDFSQEIVLNVAKKNYNDYAL